MFEFLDDNLTDEELTLFKQLVLKHFSQSSSMSSADLKNKCKDMLKELGKETLRGGHAD